VAVIAALGIAVPVASASAAITPAALPQIPGSIDWSLTCPPWYGFLNPATGCAPYWLLAYGAVMNNPFWTAAPFSHRTPALP
jgi:hypothetical protein